MKLPQNVIQRYEQFKAWMQLITFYEIAVGMQSTLWHLLHYKPITIQYPHEKRLLPENYRGMLALLRYDDGTEKCDGCDLYEAAYPVDARAITREYEWAVYNKRDFLLNKDQLLAIGDRSIQNREKRFEFQHPNVAYFNVAFPGQPLKEIQPIGSIR